MRYVVVGIGRQGLSAVYDLIKYCEASEVLAIDARFADADLLKQTQQHLIELLGEQAGAIRLEGVDLSDRAELDRLAQSARGYDCLISALPYALNLSISQVAVAAGLPMCDMGGNPDVVDRQRDLAIKLNHVIVPECGLAPGVANVLVKYLHDHHGAKIVKSYCGGLPREKPDGRANPLQYKLVFSPQGLISEYMGDCPALQNGKIKYMDALSGLERFDEEHEAFYTSNNSPRIMDYLSSLGITHYHYKTLRYHGHLEKVQVLKSLGFLQRHDNTDPELARRLTESECLKFDRQTDQDKVLLSVQGSADGETFTTIELIDVLDPVTRFTAMERTTAWGTTIVAYALATGRSRPESFATPEQFVDTKWFIEQLRRRTEKLTIH